MKKKLTLIGAITMLATLLCTVVWAAPVQQTSVLGGKVVDTVAVGTSVSEGDALIHIETIGGPMVAARATEAGKVTKVDVAVGANVEVGQTVAVIDDGK